MEVGCQHCGSKQATVIVCRMPSAMNVRHGQGEYYLCESCARRFSQECCYSGPKRDCEVCKAELASVAVQTVPVLPEGSERGIRLLMACRACALRIVESLTPQQSIWFCARGDGQTTKRERTFEVHSQPSPNATRLRLIKADGEPVQPSEWTIRTDLIPDEFRSVGSEFTFSGNGLEMDLFETWLTPASMGRFLE
jgi:hypothetical protein